ncbi:MAG: 60S ribosomal export protein NMD3 [Candidatus Aenigmarchaeota archaeon]|nr:60S ribosomal export protein NMD3 [Candidatus Aenigmarchaeota archaeon]
MKYICPKCGRKTNKLYDGLCKDCFLEEKNLFSIPKRIEVKVCKSCGRVKLGGRWKRVKSPDEIIKKHIKSKGEIENIKIDKKQINDNSFLVNVLVRGKIYGLEKTEKRKTILVKKKVLCDLCGKVKGGYYEAIIQLRSNNENKIKQAYEIIGKLIKNRDGFITKTERTKNGIDIYITPKNLINTIVKNVPNVKKKEKSYSLATRKDGRNLYRTTILLRL